MKAILGIDSHGTFLPALQLLARLRFANLEIDAVHVDNTGIFKTSHDFGFAGGAELAQLDVDDSVVERAVKDIELTGLACTHRVAYGPPAKQLVQCAEDEKAPLICIGSKRRSRFNSSLFGSTGKSLTLASRQSVLIAKGDAEGTAPLTVLATTDFSNYSEKSLRAFLRMEPKGVSRIVLVTAIDRELITRVSRDQVDLFKQFLNEKAEHLVNQFFAAGYECEHRLKDGDLGEVVEAEMEATGAELLVMGAQGEGYQPRVAIGSSALKQIVSSRHSVLIIRP